MGRGVRFGLVGVLALGSAALVSAGKPAGDVDAAGKTALAESGAKGMAIALIEKDKVVSVRSWGARNAKGDPLTADTVMYSASLTKAVFGYLVTQLAVEKKLDLDQPIAAMLPKPLPDYGNLDAYGNWGEGISLMQFGIEQGLALSVEIELQRPFSRSA